MFKVIAIAPTAYQYSSILRFGMTVTQHPGGSFSASMTFEDIWDAKEHLMNRADLYYDDVHERTSAYDAINSPWPQLTLDSVTAFIEEVEEEN